MCSSTICKLLPTISPSFSGFPAGHSQAATIPKALPLRIRSYCARPTAYFRIDPQGCQGRESRSWTSTPHSLGRLPIHKTLMQRTTNNWGLAASCIALHCALTERFRTSLSRPASLTMSWELNAGCRWRGQLVSPRLDSRCCTICLGLYKVAPCICSAITDLPSCAFIHLLTWIPQHHRVRPMQKHQKKWD